MISTCLCKAEPSSQLISVFFPLLYNVLRFFSSFKQSFISIMMNLLYSDVRQTVHTEFYLSATNENHFAIRTSINIQILFGRYSFQYVVVFFCSVFVSLFRKYVQKLEMSLNCVCTLIGRFRANKSFYHIPECNSWFQIKFYRVRYPFGVNRSIINDNQNRQHRTFFPRKFSEWKMIWLDLDLICEFYIFFCKINR